jgi:hypothetical protein
MSEAKWIQKEMRYIPLMPYGDKDIGFDLKDKNEGWSEDALAQDTVYHLTFT